MDIDINISLFTPRHRASQIVEYHLKTFPRPLRFEAWAQMSLIDSVTYPVASMAGLALQKELYTSHYFKDTTLNNASFRKLILSSTG